MYKKNTTTNTRVSFSQLVTLILFLLIINACTFISNPDNKTNSQTMHPEYNFLEPDLIITLPYKLTEISGLSYDKIYNRLLTLNDEKGDIFEIDIFNKDIITGIQKFGKKGDYEGIEKIDNITYCINSSGEIFAFNHTTNETIVYNTPLSEKNNTEGLCANTSEDGLLIACKGENLEKKKRIKAVYEFNLKTKELNTKPVFQVKIDALKDFIEDNYKKKHWKPLTTRIEDFAPSGIAINPETNDIYILSARGSSLVILSPQNEIENVLFFNTDDLPQPEGICFDKNTNLYISTEGKQEEGKICLFKHRK